MPYQPGYFARSFRDRAETRTRGHLGQLERRDTTFDVSNDASFYTGLASNYADRGINLNAGQRASAVVDRCVAMIAGSCAALDLVVSTLDGTECENDPIATLFNRNPNPVMSARVFKETVFRRLEYRGQCFNYVDRGPTAEGEPAAVWPLYWPVDVVIDDVTVPQAPTIMGYRVNTPRKVVPLLPSETLWLRYPDGETPFGCKAPLYSASFAQDLDAYARAWQLGGYKNGARPSGIMRMGALSPEQQEQVRATYQSEVGGAGNAGKIAFIFDEAIGGSGQAGFDKLSLTPMEMDYINSRKVNGEEIALAFGVSRDLLFGGVTYANQQAAKVALWSETNIPKLEVVAGEVDRQLLDDAQTSAGFDVSMVEAMQEHQDAMVKRVAIEIGRDLKTLDEGRADLGLPPLPGGVGKDTLSVYRAKFAAVVSKDPSGNTGEPSPASLMSELKLATRMLATSRGIRRLTQPVALRVIDAVATPTPPAEKRLRRVTVRDHAAVIRAYERHEAAMTRAVRRLAEKQKRVTLQRLERYRAKLGKPETRDVTGQDLFDAAFWATVTAEELESTLAAAWDEGGSTIAAALGTDFGNVSERVIREMRARLAVLSGQITDTTFKVISEGLLEEGVIQGEGIDKLAARITNVFTDLETWRAETIARTEVVSGFNAAGRLTAQESGVVTGQIWRTAGGGECSDCADLDGEETTIDGTFSSGDPGPPAHPNCRCVVEYVLQDEGDGMPSADQTDDSGDEAA